MQRKFPALWLLIPVAAVGQMAQTIYIPAIEQIAQQMQVVPGAVQAVMAGYLTAFGVSQLIYGPLSDRFGRRPLVLTGILLFLLGTLLACNATSLSMLIIASVLQGTGAGAGGVMTRTIPRDLYSGEQLRHANSFISMWLIVSPLLGPLISGVLTTYLSWRASYFFLFLLGGVVWLSMLLLFPETRPTLYKTNTLRFGYGILFKNSQFLCYSTMLVCGYAGVTLFEACSGVLMGTVLGLEPTMVSVFFVLPLPAALLGSWYAGRRTITATRLMWHAVLSNCFAGAVMWLPAWFGLITVWALLIPAALAFFSIGMLFPLATTGAMQPFAAIAGSAGAMVGGLTNLGAGAATGLSSTLPQHNQFSLGALMTALSLITLGCWLWILNSQRVPQVSS